MQGAEERRLRRMRQYAAGRSERRQRRRWCLDGGSGQNPKGWQSFTTGVHCYTFHLFLRTLTNGNQNSLVDMAYSKENKAAPKRGGQRPHFSDW